MIDKYALVTTATVGRCLRTEALAEGVSASKFQY
jgi:hypothetical protein